MSEDNESIVIDTNILVSGLLRPHSFAAKALDTASSQSVLLGSVETIQELYAVMLRPKFERYLPLAQRLLLYHVHCASLTWISITHRVHDCRDTKDNKFLELALSGHAGLILSGDADLLVLHPWHSIAILSPADYLSRRT